MKSQTLDIGRQNDLGLTTSDIEVKKVDLRDYAQTLKAIEGADVIFHLAARVGSIEYLHGSEMSELAALQTNLMLDANVFKACLEEGVKKIIYASSCAVYPMQPQFSSDAILSEPDLDLKALTHCTQETQSTQQTIGTANYRLPTVSPDGGYGWAKLMGELQLSLMARTTNSRLKTQDSGLSTIKIGIARIFNVYGENEPLRKRAHVIADLARKAILYPKEEFIVYGDGNQTRDFLYISDCVDALLKLEAALSNSANFITVNVGSGRATSVKEIAEKIIQISGRDINQKYNPGKSAGPLSRTADITKAKTLLGWEPKVSLDDGLRRTYTWAKKRLEGENVF